MMSGKLANRKMSPPIKFPDNVNKSPREKQELMELGN